MCALFMFLPLYLHGPPLASQIWSTRFPLNFFRRAASDAVAAKKPLIRLSPATRPTNSSTTAVIAFLPPRRSYSDFSFVCPRSGALDTANSTAPKEKSLYDRLRSEEHTSELQSPYDLVCRLLLEKKNNTP